jgi:hypothetical protein
MSELTKKMNAKPHNHWNSYDICSMIKMMSMGGVHYFMTFINNYSHYTWVYFPKFKSQTYQCFKSFKSVVEFKLIERLKPCEVIGVVSICLKSSSPFAIIKESREIHSRVHPTLKWCCKTKESNIAQEGEIHGV